MFTIGFSLHATVFANQTYVDPYLRGAFVKQQEHKEYGKDNSVTLQVSHILEWVLHSAVVGHSCVVFFLTWYRRADEG